MGYNSSAYILYGVREDDELFSHDDAESYETEIVNSSMFGVVRTSDCGVNYYGFILSEVDGTGSTMIDCAEFAPNVILPLKKWFNDSDVFGECVPKLRLISTYL